MDLEATVTHDVNDMARYWGLRKFQYLDAASMEFDLLVEPMPADDDREPTLDEILAINKAFTEWVLFERPFGNGETPLQRYLAHPPRSATHEAIERLRQVERTQFFSRFAIRDKDPKACISVLEDVQTFERYEVLDSVIARRREWSQGSVGVRIAQVDGQWLTAGLLRLYDRALPQQTAQDGPGFVHVEDEGL